MTVVVLAGKDTSSVDVKMGLHSVSIVVLSKDLTLAGKDTSSVYVKMGLPSVSIVVLSKALIAVP